MLDSIYQWCFSFHSFTSYRDPAAILQAVQQAASSAAQATQALKEATDRRIGGFSDASKVVRCPKEFGHANSLDDQAGWSDFAFAFRQWLVFADPSYEADMKHVEDNPGLEVVYQATAQGASSRERSRKLYAILAGILKHRPLKMLRQINDSNGFEVWRQLSNLCTPKTKGRSLALLSALMSYQRNALW